MLKLKDLLEVSQSVKGRTLEDKLVHFSVDNRSLNADSCFIAIVGNRYNPLEHLDGVVASGCKVVVCEEAPQISHFDKKLTFIIVKDIVTAIQAIGKKVAERFKKSCGGQIIAISGSNGKTTTKEMLFHLLNTHYAGQVICTQKNNNNHLGVPFTLFQIRETTKYAIVELGSNHPGEIELLCKILQPNIGVTTNIGATHLEFFHTLDAVYKEEATLGKYADIFFINSDDNLLKDFQAQGRGLKFGQSAGDFKFKYGKNLVRINEKEYSNENITGEHNFTNLAVAIILAEQVSPNKDFQAAAATFKPTRNRSEWLEWKGLKVFLDAYNANPSSMILAIKGFFEIASENSVLILGDMNELGSDASKFHRELGEKLNKFSFKKAVFIGRFASDYQMGFKGLSESFASTQDFVQALDEPSQVADYFFIKGSRSLQLETILDI